MAAAGRQEEEDTVKRKWDLLGHKWEPPLPVTKVRVVSDPPGAVQAGPPPGPLHSARISKDYATTPTLLFSLTVK